MVNDFSQRHKIVYHIWLLLCAAVCVLVSLYRRQIPALYQGKILGIFGCILMSVLALFSCVTGDPLPGFEETEPSFGRKSRRNSFAALGIFLAATAAEFGCAYYGIHVRSGGLIHDALVTSGILCASFLLARKAACSHPSSPAR